LLTTSVIARQFDVSGARTPDLPNPDLEAYSECSNTVRVAVRENAGANFRSEIRALIVQIQTDLQSGGIGSISCEKVGRVTFWLEQPEATINEARAAEVHTCVRSAVDSVLLIRSMSAISLFRLADLEEVRATVAKIIDDRRPALDKRIANAVANVDRRIAVIAVQIAELQTTLRILARADPKTVAASHWDNGDGLCAAGLVLYDE